MLLLVMWGCSEPASFFVYLDPWDGHSMGVITMHGEECHLSGGSLHMDDGELWRVVPDTDDCRMDQAVLAGGTGDLEIGYTVDRQPGLRDHTDAWLIFTATLDGRHLVLEDGAGGVGPASWLRP